MVVKKLFQKVYYKLKIALYFSLFTFCLLPVIVVFSQNIDSIPLLINSTHDASEQVLLLTDYAQRKINVNEFISAKKSAEKAFDIAKNAEFNFGKATSLARIGEIEARQNSFGAAYKHFEAAEQIFLKDGDKTDCAQLYFSWAKTALLYKKADDAIRFASSALNFYVFDSQLPYFESDLHKILGESWLQKNQQGRALGEFDESLKLLNDNFISEPIKSKFTFEMAELFFAGKNYDDAITFFSAALSSDIKVNDSFRIATDKINLAKCHLKLKEPKTALPYGMQSLAYFEKHRDTLNTALTHLLLAEIYLKEDSKAKANTELNKAESLITLLPVGISNLTALNELSRLYGKIGDRKKEKLYLIKYTSYKENSQPKNGDIFTSNSEETPVAIKQNFLQNLRSKIDAKLIIFLLGFAAIFTKVFLFARPKKLTAMSNEQLAVIEEQKIISEKPAIFKNESYVIHTEPKKFFVENSISHFLIQLTTHFKNQNLLSNSEINFMEDDNFLVHAVQQKNLENILESILKATKIIFNEPTRNLKFSKSDVEINSFTLKTTIELPKNVETEKVFKSFLITDQSDFSFDGYITEFKKQLTNSNSHAVFAQLVNTNYLIFFTEIFDASE